MGRGLAADFGWLGHLDAGFRDLEYPPVINLFIEASAKLTHVVLGTSDDELERRRSLTAAQLYDLPGMAGEERTFLIVTCVGLMVAVLATVWVAWRAGWTLGDRVTWLVLTPLIVLTLTVNWDALALLAAAVALLAWQRQRKAWFGVCVALGVATTLFPLVLLAAGMLIAIRARSARALATMTVAFALATVAVNAPLYVCSHQAWREFWDTSVDRPASFGSAWMATRMVGLPVGADNLGLVLGVGMLVAWAVLGLMTWRRTIEPTITEQAVVFLVVFFVLGKVYSPQYSLWVVLGLLVVTRNRWLIVAVALAETWHYVATWLYIRELTTPEVGIGKTYWSAIVLRLAAEAAIVVYVLSRARRRVTRDEPPPDPLTVVS